MRIAVLGDPMLDVWTDLTVVRPNPEEPTVPVVRHEASSVHPGGALNVAANLAALGHTVAYVDVCRRSPGDASRLVELLTEARVSYLPVTTEGEETPLTRKERVRVDGRLLYRRDRDETPDTVAHCGDTLSELWDFQPDAVILVDYDKGTLAPTANTLAILGALKNYRWLTILDAKPVLHRLVLSNLDVWGSHLVCKANRLEATKTAGTPDAVAWGHRMTDARVVITMGDQGARWADWMTADSGEYAPHVMLNSRPSVCGAGDVFTAVLVDGLLENQSLGQATRRAVDLASTAVSSGQRETLLLAEEDALFTDPDRD